MPKIIATGGGTDEELKQNPLNALWEKFSSLDKFSKTLVTTTVLFLVFASAITTLTLSLRSSAGGEGIARVDIHPGLVNILVGKTLALSTLAFDGNGSAVNSGVVYEWSMSSASSTATLSKINGQITELTALNVGCGALTVIARDGLQTVTKSIQVVVSDSSNSIPACANLTPTPTPNLSKTPTPTSYPTPTKYVTPTNYYTPTPTPIKSTSLELTPVADSYVRADITNKNYGSGKAIRVNGKPGVNGYLKFDLRSLAGKKITGAKLGLYVLDIKGSGSPGTQSLVRVANKSWTENSINYKNAPKTISIFSSFTTAKRNSYIYFDVTGWAVENRGSFASFAISNSSNNEAVFGAREQANASMRPTIIIYYEANPTPTKYVTPTYYSTPTPTSIYPTNTPTPH